jgi:hypothetical protein
MFGLKKSALGGAKYISKLNVAPEVELTVCVSGMVSGTRVANQHGWCDVDTIVPGDKVLTFDGGMQSVRSINLTRGSQLSEGWLLKVPAHALGNREVVYLLPKQNVMIESDMAEETFGDPFALIPAAALEGQRGIERIVPDEGLNIVTLEFEQDEVVFANIGALFHCPRNDASLLEYTDQRPYTALSMPDACLLAQAITVEDATRPTVAA